MRILAIVGALVVAHAAHGSALGQFSPIPNGNHTTPSNRPTAGLGLSFLFGGGAPQVGLDLRIFSGNRQDSGVASVGIDYLFGSQTWRPTIGPTFG